MTYVWNIEVVAAVGQGAGGDRWTVNSGWVDVATGGMSAVIISPKWVCVQSCCIELRGIFGGCLEDEDDF